MEFGARYQANKYLSLSAQYSMEASFSDSSCNANPSRPPLPGGKELAPVPMRFRGDGALFIKQSNQAVIRKVLNADRFEIHEILVDGNTISIALPNENSGP